MKENQIFEEISVEEQSRRIYEADAKAQREIMEAKELKNKYDWLLPVLLFFLTLTLIVVIGLKKDYEQDLKITELERQVLNLKNTQVIPR